MKEIKCPVCKGDYGKRIDKDIKRLGEEEKF